MFFKQSGAWRPAVNVTCYETERWTFLFPPRKDEFMISDLMESGQKQPLTHSAERGVAEDDDDEEHAAQHVRAASARKEEDWGKIFITSRNPRERQKLSSSQLLKPTDKLYAMSCDAIHADLPRSDRADLGFTATGVNTYANHNFNVFGGFGCFRFWFCYYRSSEQYRLHESFFFKIGAVFFSPSKQSEWILYLWPNQLFTHFPTLWNFPLVQNSALMMSSRTRLERSNPISRN